jgi:hypothetical protein
MLRNRRSRAGAADAGAGSGEPDSGEAEVAKGHPQVERYPQAVRDLADQLDMRFRQIQQAPASLEAQPRVMREAVMRRIAVKWLTGQGTSQ